MEKHIHCIGTYITVLCGSLYGCTQLFAEIPDIPVDEYYIYIDCMQKRRNIFSSESYIILWLYIYNSQAIFYGAVSSLPAEHSQVIHIGVFFFKLLPIFSRNFSIFHNFLFFFPKIGMLGPALTRVKKKKKKRTDFRFSKKTAGRLSPNEGKKNENNIKQK